MRYIEANNMSYLTTPPENKNLPYADYRPDIDGLRALAVLLVILYHYFPGRIKGGFIGVDIFFVISGYLICGNILKDIDNDNFSFLKFYYRRIRRIFPSLIVVLIFVLILSWFTLFPIELKSLGKHIIGSSLFISNIISYNEIGYFDFNSYLKPLLHLWSLGIEEQFYLILPFLLFLTARKRFNIAVMIFMICSLSLFENIRQYRLKPDLDFYLPFTRFWELLFGALLSALHRQIPSLNTNELNKFNINLKNNASKNYINALKNCLINYKNNNLRIFNDLNSFLGFIFIIIALIYARSTYHWPGILALLPVIGTVLIINGNSKAFINKKILSNNILVNIGLISYPLYLWHYPFISFIYIFYGDIRSRFSFYTILLLKTSLILLSFLLSYCTYKYIEKPIRSNKNSKKYVNILISFIFIICLSGILIFCNDGFMQRKFVSKQADKLNQLSIFYSEIINNCPNFNYIASESMSKCSVSKTNFAKTIAIIGDSHAHSAYYGFEKLSNKYGFNTILLSWYVPSGELINPKLAKNIPIIFEYLLQHDDIVTIIISLYGSNYLRSTTDFSRGVIPYSDFKQSLQEFVNLMIINGKNVYISNDNPNFTGTLHSYISRPLVNMNPTPPIVLKKDIINRHSVYDGLLAEIKGAKVLDIKNIFCPTDKCILFSDTGLPLYFDGNHLSKIGSEYQAKQIIDSNLIDLSALVK
jgi:peptidoglycan/LPS O-acetylase OafA/YrhL